MNRRFLPIPLAGLALVAGCAVGPDYRRPAFQTTDGFKEAADWKPTEPGDAMSRGPWWAIFKDDDLDRLETRIRISNENVKAAAAAVDQARALVAQAQAGFWPSINAGAGLQRGSIDGVPARQTVSATLSGDWTLDIWGQIRRTVESDKASAQASAAALADVGCELAIVHLRPPHTPEVLEPLAQALADIG